MIHHDLRPDAAALRSYIEERVAKFDRDTNDAPGAADADIALIQIGFEHEQSGYVAIVLDTRPDADADGEWTMHIESEKNWLEFPPWGAITAESCENLRLGRAENAKLEFTTIDGSTRTFDWNRGDVYEYATIFGDMIKEVVLAARDDGIFARLPLTNDCQICIEMISGLFAWPATDDVIEPAIAGKGTN